MVAFVFSSSLPKIKRYREKSYFGCSSPRKHKTQMTTKVISGLSDVATSYKCLLLDQFGVIHDGQRIYPGALNALLQAHRSGLKNVIISNSSQRASNTLRKLQRFNIDSACISAVVTSGELAFKKLPIFAARNPNARVLHFNWGSSRNPVSIHDHGFSCLAPCTRSFCGVSVPAAEDVDVIVAHGTDGFVCHDGSMTSLDWDVAIRLICDIAKSSPQVPFFCANPDLVTVDGATLRRMPGSLAKAFEDAGGKSVYRLGKPDPAIYIEALQVAGVDRGDILAVGDSLAHDVLGASDAGIDTLYIAGGINARRFNLDPKEGFFVEKKYEWPNWDRRILDEIVAEEAPKLGHRRPTYASPYFRW